MKRGILTTIVVLLATLAAVSGCYSNASSLERSGGRTNMVAKGDSRTIYDMLHSRATSTLQVGAFTASYQVQGSYDPTTKTGQISSSLVGVMYSQPNAYIKIRQEALDTCSVTVFWMKGLVGDNRIIAAAVEKWLRDESMLIQSDYRVE